TAGGPRRAGRRGRRAGEGSVPTGAVPVVLRCCVIHSPILRACHFRNQARGESVDELVSPHGNVDRIVEEVAVWRNGGCGGGDVDGVTLLLIRVGRTWLSVDGAALMGPHEWLDIEFSGRSPNMLGGGPVNTSTEIVHNPRLWRNDSPCDATDR